MFDSILYFIYLYWNVFVIIIIYFNIKINFFTNEKNELCF